MVSILKTYTITSIESATSVLFLHGAKEKGGGRKEGGEGDEPGNEDSSEGT